MSDMPPRALEMSARVHKKCFIFSEEEFKNVHYYGSKIQRRVLRGFDSSQRDMDMASGQDCKDVPGSELSGCFDI